jgi:hypothetical protein
MDVAGGSGLDTTVFVRRALNIIHSSLSSPDGASWVIRADGQAGQVPSGVRLGSSGCYLQASGTTIYPASNYAGGTGVDLQARTLAATQGFRFGSTTGTQMSSGSGAPAIAGTAGDWYYRTDTPTVANQRQYICTVTGGAGAATWVGVL